MTVYLDNSATTKICDKALATYISVSTENYGNPSSLHFIGENASRILESAKKTVMKTIHADSGTVVFTASGTEANNLAIFGRAYAKERFRNKAMIITTDGEHSSVLSPLSRLGEEGYKIYRIPTVGGGADLEALSGMIDKSCALVTVMMVNNETGALYDVAGIGRIIRAKAPDAFLHVDATQAYMKVPINVKSSGIDMLTISSHKIEGPKGVGALYLSDRVIRSRGIVPVTLGGGQGDGLRSGTENVPGIAGFSEACRYQNDNFASFSERLGELREYLINLLSDEKFSEIRILEPKKYAPHIVNIILPKIKSQTMLNYLSSFGICVSSGSACSSHSHHASSALAAFGISDEDSDYSIRISLSHNNTEEELCYFTGKLYDGITSLQRVK